MNSSDDASTDSDANALKMEQAESQTGQPELRYVPETSGRPTGVTVFAILHVLFGLAGIGGTLFSIVFALLDVSLAAGPNPILDAINENEAYRSYTFVMGIVGVFFSIALIASGLGLLKVRAWARTVSLVYGVYGIVFAIIGNVVNYFALYKPILEKVAGADGGQDLVVVGGIIGGVAGSCIGLVYPVAIVIYFLRPSIRKLFKEGLPSTASDG